MPRLVASSSLSGVPSQCPTSSFSCANSVQELLRFAALHPAIIRVAYLLSAMGDDLTRHVLAVATLLAPTPLHLLYSGYTPASFLSISMVYFHFSVCYNLTTSVN